MQRRATHLDASLSKERARAAQLEEGLAASEAGRSEAMARCEAYESGVYGLPQVRGRCLAGATSACQCLQFQPRHAISHCHALPHRQRKRLGLSRRP